MRSTYFIGVFMIFFHVFASVKSANILSLVEVLEPDQQPWYDALFKGLIGRGHTLTMVSGNIIPTTSPHISQIHLEQITTVMKANNSPKLFTNSWLRPFEQVIYWYDRQMKICKSVLSSKGLLELIEMARATADERPFDLILYDATYGPSCLLALTQLFESVPIVAISASNITPDLVSVVHNAQVQPATIPHFLTAHSEKMNFFQRLHNTIIYAMGNLIRQFIVRSVQEAMLAKSEQLKEVPIKPKLDNIIDRIKVVLVNSHPAIDYAHSLPPNVVEVGGLQFDNVNRALSVDMQTFIDNSKEGVFVIMIGQTEDSNILSNELIESVINTVDRFPEYGFLWRVEKSLLSSDSNRQNLFVGKWLKRSNILAQRKVKGVITAGSHMEIQEAVYHGVPIIGISNEVNNFAQRVEELGVGTYVNLGSDPEMLTKGIKAIISDPKYSEKAKLRQLAFRSRPQHPLDEAIWWIEHVLAHPIESGFLFSQGVAKASFFVLHSMDVIAVFVFILAIFLINCFIVLKQLRESCKMKNQPENVAKNTSPKRKLKKSESSKKKSQ